MAGPWIGIALSLAELALDRGLFKAGYAPKAQSFVARLREAEANNRDLPTDYIEQINRELAGELAQHSQRAGEAAAEIERRKRVAEEDASSPLATSVTAENE